MVGSAAGEVAYTLQQFSSSRRIAGSFACAGRSRTNHGSMHTKPPPSVAEQMRVLCSGEDVARYALQHLGLHAEWRDTNEPGNTERCQEAVNQVFTLTRADVEAGLAAQGLQPENLSRFYTKKDSRDGWYFIPKKGGWDFYWQERGYPNFLVSFDDLAEARKLLINEFIPVWLEHLHVPCRAKDGRTLTRL